MGRRKLGIKRIENKSSRLVTFSKRRMGLIKKARDLSVLCDVDVAVIVFSGHGKLYESCSGATNSVEHLLARYEAECRSIKGGGQDLELPLECSNFRTCTELLQTVDRLVEENNNNNNEEFSVTDMTQLEEELDAALMQVRSRKTQLMMEYITTLQERERNLNKEKEETIQQIASSAEHVFRAGDDSNLSVNQTDSPQHVTLPLFYT